MDGREREGCVENLNFSENICRSEPKKSSKLRKRLSFNTTAGSIKRKADLFELPTYAKKVIYMYIYMYVYTQMQICKSNMQIHKCKFANTQFWAKIGDTIHEIWSYGF